MRTLPTSFAACALPILAGCASLTPDSVSIFTQHISHATQHEPFTTEPTNYGSDIAGIAVAYTPLSRLHLSLSEGATIEPCDRVLNQRECGGMWGPREVFQATISYEVWHK